MCRRLVDFPDRPTAVARLEIGEVVVEGAKILPVKLPEGDVRSVVKCLWEGADLESFEPLLCAVYRVELTKRKRRSRRVVLDGGTGKELVL